MSHEEYSEVTCPVCGAELAAGLRSWHRVCTSCGYEGSTLQVKILEQAPGGDLDESAREDALVTLRRSNFKRLLGMIAQLVPKTLLAGRARLLDVGCAHGWFIEKARERYDVVGIEPDHAVAAAGIVRGLPVRGGFFPNVLDVDERFEIIVFNDVLEHIPNVNNVLSTCRHHLSLGGLLVVNAPNRSGAMYWVSKQLLRLGRSGPFERLWQSGFPSPHVHYFDSKSITRLASQQGFTKVGSKRLSSVSLSGLYSRIRYSKAVSPIRAVFLSIIVAIAIPILRVLPSDIKVWFFIRNGE